MAPETLQSATRRAQPSQDELEDIILSARYGELEEIQDFVQKFGIAALADSRDERGNGCLHMAAANGHKGMLTYWEGFAALADCMFTEPWPSFQRHSLTSATTDIIEFLLPQVSPEALAAVNQSGNTPLHWAAMNGHIDTLRVLVPALPKSALFLKNQFGRDALSEAENAVPEGDKAASSPQEECAGYLLTFMELEKEKSANEQEADEPVQESDTGGKPAEADSETASGGDDKKGEKAAPQ